MDLNGSTTMSNFKVLSIPDIHGRDYWKIACFGSRAAYEAWRKNCDNPDYDISNLPFFKYDWVVFIGDYLDSFDIQPIDIKRNLEEIIHFKLKFVDKVILLYGNHDVSYKNNMHCAGFQAAMKWDYVQLLKTKHKGDSIFQVAFQYKDWLWSHAGITMGFYEDIIKPLSNSKKTRFWAFYQDCKDMAETLNFMYNSNNEDIFKSTHVRGGWSRVPGPFWADKSELNHKPALGLNQVVGHTPSDMIRQFEYGGGRYAEHPITLCFIDNFGETSSLNQVMSIDFSTEKPTIEIIDLQIYD